MIRIFYSLILAVSFVCCSTNIQAQRIPSLEWVGSLGCYGLDIALDKDANVYTTGYFFGTNMDFDPGPGVYPLTAARHDGFVSKLDASGNFIWAKQFEGSGNSNNLYCDAIAVDDSGNVYTTGRFTGTYDFDPGPGVQAFSTPSALSNYYHMFISKLDKDGNFVWARSLEIGTGGEDIKVNAAGDIFIVGYFGGTIDFDPGPGVYQLSSNPSSRYSSGFILKLNAAGEFVWAQALNGVGQILCLDVDSSSDVYIAAHLHAAQDFLTRSGIYTVSPVDSVNIVIARLDSAGTAQWAKVISSDHGIGGRRITTDNNKNVYIHGMFSGTADFNPDPANTHLITTDSFRLLTTSYPATSAYVLKLDSAGNFVWTSHFNASRHMLTEGIAVEPMGKAIYTIGIFKDTVDFDPGPGVYNMMGTGPYTSYSGTKNSVYITKLNSDGSLGWATALHNTRTNGTDNRGFGVALDNDGAIYSVGWYLDSTDFDPDTAVYHLPGSSNGARTPTFVLKLADDCRYLSREFPIQGENIICPAGRYTYTVDSVPNATYTWTLPEGWIGNSTGPTIDVVNNGLGTISVQITTQCDSTVQYLTTIPAMDELHVTVDSFTLGTASPNYDTWQWYYNGNLIRDATSSGYTVTENGEYCVVVTKDDCTDTACYEVNNVPPASIHSLHNGNNISIYPNPASGIITLKTETGLQNTTIRFIHLTGKTIGTYQNPKSNTLTFDISAYAPGIYFIEITGSGKTTRTKFTKY